MRHSLKVVTALLVGVSQFSLAQSLPPDTVASPFVAGTVHQHDSRIFGERRTYYVYLPPSYADTSFGPRRYPVIYVLDAPVVWQYVTGAHNLLVDWGYQWPQAIVVGIRTAKRSRDFTPTRDSVSASGEVVSMWHESGGAPIFLQYVAEELIPRIERRYRTTANRTLVGHSLGGLFALYVLAERPSLFRNYMVLDPATWWSGGMVEHTVPTALRNESSGPVTILFGRADVVSAGLPAAQSQALAASQTRLADALTSLRSERVRVDVRRYDGEEHVSMLIPAIHHSMRLFFGGPIIPESLLADVAGLESRARTLSTTLGIDSLPDPFEVSPAADDLLQTPSRRSAAIGLFRLNTRSFPDRSRAHRELGLALIVVGDTAAARASLREALRLAPRDTVVRRRLREIGG